MTSSEASGRSRSPDKSGQSARHRTAPTSSVPSPNSGTAGCSLGTRADKGGAVGWLGAVSVGGTESPHHLEFGLPWAAPFATVAPPLPPLKRQSSRRSTPPLRRDQVGSEGAGKRRPAIDAGVDEPWNAIICGENARMSLKYSTIHDSSASSGSKETQACELREASDALTLPRHSQGHMLSKIVAYKSLVQQGLQRACPLQRVQAAQ